MQEHTGFGHGNTIYKILHRHGTYCTASGAVLRCGLVLSGVGGGGWLGGWRRRFFQWALVLEYFFSLSGQRVDQLLGTGAHGTKELFFERS